MIEIRPFIQLGRRELEPYLAGVESFLARLGTAGGLEKTSLRSRPVDSYVRNMLAVGTLNRIMGAAFLKTERKIIVLPDCLKNYSGWECCKSDLGNESECIQCTPECAVYEMMELFADSRTSIVLEPEDMDTYFSEVRREFGCVGIVGVACVLTMLSGFEKTLKHRHPTQGVFLNYSSCAHHWANPAYNTSFSLQRMAGILNRKGAEPKDQIGNRGETYSLEKPNLSPDDFYRRLDNLADVFEEEYLPLFLAADPGADLYALCQRVQSVIVPDLITRDSA